MMPLRVSRLIASGILAAGCFLAPLTAGADPSSSVDNAAADAISAGVVRMPLFGRMERANQALHSYQSHVQLKIAMHTFPFLAPTLEGTAYYKAPDRNAVIFDSVPALASLFKKVFPRLDPPGTWTRLYRVGVIGEGGGRTGFRLVPRKYGTIAYLDVAVDQSSALPVGYTYYYRNGGQIHFDQVVERLGSVYVVTSLNGHVNLPSTNADASSTFSNYKINVPIKDDVFNEPSS